MVFRERHNVLVPLDKASISCILGNDEGFSGTIGCHENKADVALVETALATLQLLVSKPPALFDPYAALAALEHLVDSAREVRHERAKRYAVILR